LKIVIALLVRSIDINSRYANDLTLLMWAAGPDARVSEPQANQGVSYLAGRPARIS